MTVADRMPMPPVEDLIHRRTAPEEAPRIAALLRDVQPDNPKGDVDVLRWQYWENPYGEVSSWVLEVPGGPLVAHHMAYPLQGYVGGRVVPMGKSGDLVTVEAARGVGAASRLTAGTYRDMGARGCRHTFATPNGTSRGAVGRGGVDYIGQLPLWLRPLDDGWVADQLPLLGGAAARTAAAAARRVAFRPRVRPDGERVETIPSDVDALWAAAVALEPGVNRIVHDRTWWGWRYARPATRYGLHVLRRGGRTAALAATLVRVIGNAPVLHVLDVLTRHVDDGAAVVAAATADAAAEVVAVAGCALPGTVAAATLAKAGLRNIPPRVHPRRSFLGFARNTPESEDLSTVPWTITWADFDHL